jgi:hypothetical protein
MLFRQSEKKGADDELRKLASPAAQLHSIPAISRGRQFRGKLELSGAGYEVVFAPARASVAGRRLQLQGRLTVKDARGQRRSRDNVRATLVGIQGGIGTAPPRRQLPTSVATETPQPPEVESTGPTSFCGAMYIHLEPVAGNSLGVPADMSRVQLNVRFAPVDDSERVLQSVYSTIVDALYGKQIDPRAAADAVSELNTLLAGT